MARAAQPLPGQGPLRRSAPDHADVTRVLELAEERKDVYRHIRHLLTSSFVPISRNNVWHQILAELRPTALWQRLAEQALAEEARFSARSKAGHRSRRSTEDAGAESSGPSTRSNCARSTTRISTATSSCPAATKRMRQRLSLAISRKPWHRGPRKPQLQVPTMVAKPLLQRATKVWTKDRQSSGGPSNQGRATSVAPSNPMYDQSIQTTRTRKGDRDQGAEEVVTEDSRAVTGVVTSTGIPLSQVGAGPGNELAPGNGPDRAAALVAFAEANGRTASVAEERLLGRIARTPAPRRAGRS